MGLVLLSIGGVALAMLAMAVGVLFSDRCLRGSCGGKDLRGPDGELLLCDSCPRRRELLGPAADCPRTRARRPSLDALPEAEVARTRRSGRRVSTAAIVRSRNADRK